MFHNELPKDSLARGGGGGGILPGGETHSSAPSLVTGHLVQARGMVPDQGRY